jgi:nitrite reductase (NO-forming)
MEPPAPLATASPARPAAAGSCRRRPRPRPDGALRPTDVVGVFFAAGIAFLLAAAVAGAVQWLDPWPWGRWLALHLAFVGGVSQLVLGASQFFAGAFLATEPPPRALVRAQALAWNAGAALLAVAIPEGAGTAIWIAVALLLAGLGAWAAAIVAMRRRSLRRSPWATRWYASAAAFFGLGMVAGSLLAHGASWPYGNLLGAHISLNLAGWFGAAIVGTLHTFYPSLTQTELRHPRLQGVAFLAWTGGVAALAAGYGWAIDPVAVAGWLALCVAAVALLANVAASLRAAPRPLSLAARLVGVAQPFLLAGLLIAAVASIEHGAAHALVGSTRAAVGTLLVAGWIGLTVAGSLLHLLAVVVRVRDFSRGMPVARPRLDGPLAALAGLGVVAVALSQSAAPGGWGAPARAALLLAYVVLGGRIAVLAGRVLVKARPSI